MTSSTATTISTVRSTIRSKSESSFKKPQQPNGITLTKAAILKHIEESTDEQQFFALNLEQALTRLQQKIESQGQNFEAKINAEEMSNDKNEERAQAFLARAEAVLQQVREGGASGRKVTTLAHRAHMQALKAYRLALVPTSENPQQAIVWEKFRARFFKTRALCHLLMGNERLCQQDLSRWLLDYAHRPELQVANVAEIRTICRRIFSSLYDGLLKVAKTGNGVRTATRIKSIVGRIDALLTDEVFAEERAIAQDSTLTSEQKKQELASLRTHLLYCHLTVREQVLASLPAGDSWRLLSVVEAEAAQRTKEENRVKKRERAQAKKTNEKEAQPDKKTQDLLHRARALLNQVSQTLQDKQQPQSPRSSVDSSISVDLTSASQCPPPDPKMPKRQNSRIKRTRSDALEHIRLIPDLTGMRGDKALIKHSIAQENVIFTEKLLALKWDSGLGTTFCAACYRAVSDRFVPCTACVRAVFCSEVCMRLARATHHRDALCTGHRYHQQLNYRPSYLLYQMIGNAGGWKGIQLLIETAAQQPKNEPEPLQRRILLWTNTLKYVKPEWPLLELVLALGSNAVAMVKNDESFDPKILLETYHLAKVLERAYPKSNHSSATPTDTNKPYTHQDSAYISPTSPQAMALLYALMTALENHPLAYNKLMSIKLEIKKQGSQYKQTGKPYGYGLGPFGGVLGVARNGSPTVYARFNPAAGRIEYVALRPFKAGDELIIDCSPEFRPYFEERPDSGPSLTKLAF